MHEVCVIGAGWAGLSAAFELTAAGVDVVVLDKARGPGGRCSTRRHGDFAFDHGGQYFTARSEAFADAVRGWKQEGLVAAWRPRIRVFGRRPSNPGTTPAERLVGVPGMNAVLKRLSARLDCRFGGRVEELRRERNHWLVRRDRGDEILARSVLLTAPPAQAAELLAGRSELAETASRVPMNPCWALMLGFDGPLDADFDAAFDNEGPLSWLARNSSKPGRSGEAWLLHAGPNWSRQHLEAEPDWVADQLLAAFHARIPSAAETTPALVSAHRWRYALAPAPLEQECLGEARQRLVLAGDWCAGNRIEGAWVSGRAAAAQLLEWIGAVDGFNGEPDQPG